MSHFPTCLFLLSTLQNDFSGFMETFFGSCGLWVNLLGQLDLGRLAVLNQSLPCTEIANLFILKKTLINF